MNMDFGANKKPIAMIKKGTIAATYFTYIYSGVNSTW